jgi:hypothetical protein
VLADLAEVVRLAGKPEESAAHREAGRLSDQKGYVALAAILASRTSTSAPSSQAY